MERSIDGWIAHAERMQRIGNHGGAIDALKRALAEEPTHASAHALLAQSLLATRRVHAAAREAGEALQQEPELPLALYAFAAAAMAQRRWTDARQALETLLAAEPDDPANLRLMAELRRRDDPRAALPLLERAREIDPDDVYTLVDLGEVTLQLGDASRADALAQAALGHAPELVAAHVLAGRIALQRGDARTTREHVGAALRADPGDQGALWLLTGLKARENPLLGLWWRLQVLLGEGGSGRSLAILLGMLVVVRVAIIVAEACERPGLALLLSYAWLGFCLYTWAAPELFRRMLQRELATVDLKPGF
ncbi:MAG: tetratricopeptide repeat protein [Myxococcales bacterium]|nr:tetratricopeptide repeat protein [Myxococcales bacterium]